MKSPFLYYLVLPLWLMVTLAQAQPILYTFNGDNADDEFGFSVNAAGDVNNDGYADVIVGGRLNDNYIDGAGTARVLSGVDGNILYVFNGNREGAQFGYSVSSAGDVNNDGYADVVVGAPIDHGSSVLIESGSARIFSGVNGSILYTFNGDSALDHFGVSVSGAGDVNNDGYADVIVGAYHDDNNGTDSGSARVFSGKTGIALYTFNGDSTDDYFGISVSGAGDVNNDGYADVIVGAYRDDNSGTDSGSVRVFSGKTGGILYTFNGDNVGDEFGFSVNAAGDVNNDGYDDVIVGAHLDDNNFRTSSGSARILSGANGSILYTFNGDSADDRFGISVGGAGDVNNDGYADVFVGAYGDDNNGTNSGSARVLSGANGSILYTFNGDSAGDQFGRSVGIAGDMNNDGYADVIAGANLDDNNDSRSGSARVFSGKGLWMDADGDGQNNAVDNDDDNDGTLDINDYAPLNPASLGDPDSDDIDGLTDNCPTTFNPAQSDTDNDDQGDACDSDIDGDGVLNTTDSFVYDSTRSTGNTNILHSFYGDSASDWFGASVSSAGDVNNDGYTDVIIGIYLDDNNGSASGSARIFSGINGGILYTFNGDSAGDRFGYSVSGAGDVNNDGYDDVIVGASYDDNSGAESGSARVFNGKTGSILYTFNGDSADDRFGDSVSGAGDVNNDGYDDVIVGAYWDDNNGRTDSGMARVFNGKTGSILYTFNGDSANDYFGSAVSSAGDVNNDGYADMIVGAFLDDNNSRTDSGMARVFSGKTGVALYTFNGDSANDRFGYSVSGAGDVNNDGYDDVIVGANLDDNNGRMDSGSARVFSGKTASILYTFDGDSAGDWFGYSVSAAGDVNNDGYDDLVVGAYKDDNNGTYSGSARVLSGANGSILYTSNGDSADDQLGYSVSDAGDVNGDGYSDVIVGANLDDNNGSSSGSARIFSGRGLWTNTDGDGQNDAIDSDDDNDGILDINDAAPRGNGVDTDSDGTINDFDWDDDNDGVPDTIDLAPLDAGDTSEIVLPLDGAYKGGVLQKQGLSE